MDAIAILTQEQATGLKEVNQAVNAMDHTTQQNAAMDEQSNAASAALAAEARKLRQLIGHFTLQSIEVNGNVALRTIATDMRRMNRGTQPSRLDSYVPPVSSQT